MYENTNSSIDWKGIILKVIIAFLVVAIAFTGIKTFTKGKVNKTPETTNVVESNSSTTFTANIEKLKEVGEKYFSENTDKLPKDGTTSMVTLNELINANAITSLTDADGKVCDGESSYVTAVKTGDKYTIKANLVCGESYSYVTAYLGENDTKVEETKTTITNNGTSTVTNSNKVSSTKTNTSSCGTSCTPVVSTEVKQNVTINTNKNNASNNTNVSKRQYIVSFDGNGGTCYYKSYYVNEGEYASNPGICSRSGYNFIGWYLDGRVYNFNTPVTRDIKLVAQYSINNGYIYDSIDDDIYDTNRGFVETYVYTMGWAKYNINNLTINHTLSVKNALDKIEYNTNLDRDDISKIRITNIKYIQAIDTETEAITYWNNHASTFLNSDSAKVNASNKKTDSSLAYIKSAEFVFDDDFVSLSTAKRNGFDVTWKTDIITRSCSSPFDLNLGYDANLGYNNIAYDLCNYGIIYKVNWVYKY